MRKVSGFVLKNWLWIALGIILTKFAVEYAYQERGYIAYGGEWLVLPCLLLAVSMARDAAGYVMVICVRAWLQPGKGRKRRRR